MTVPVFRSTAAFVRRQRASAPTADRATFLVFGFGEHRFAVPVESVERVLRVPSAGPEIPVSVEHGGRAIRALDLRSVLAPDSEAAARAALRALVFTLQGAWAAAIVDTVLEVATVDVSVVQLMTSDGGWSTTTPVAPGARGYFVRHGHPVIVLDMLRVMRALFEAQQRAAARAALDLA